MEAEAGWEGDRMEEKLEYYKYTRRGGDGGGKRKASGIPPGEREGGGGSRHYKKGSPARSKRKIAYVSEGKIVCATCIISP